MHSNIRDLKLSLEETYTIPEIILITTIILRYFNYQNVHSRRVGLY